MAQKKTEAETESDKFGILYRTKIAEVLADAIPIWRAEFHAAVNNSDDVPEHYFSSKSALKSRQVEMWWVKNDGLWCLHKNQYFIVPAATVKFAKVQ
jgi:hypothetical protein